MVKKGNLEKIMTIAGNAGKIIFGRGRRTTNADFLIAQSKILAKQGKKPITVKTFPKDTDAANALATGKVDAYFGDAPVVAYYVGKARTQFEFGGKAGQSESRRGHRDAQGAMPYTPAMKKAVTALYRQRDDEEQHPRQAGRCPAPR